MKKFFKSSAYALLLMTALIFTACQEEFEELPQPDDPQTITASSSTAKLIEDTCTNDGSFDNIVDGASCFSIEFPYTVNVNGIEITLDSREDLHLIEEIFDELETDDDILEIIFPITVTLGDFRELVIEGIEDLRALAEECIEGGDDDDIECIDFVYPITLFTFDVNEVQTGTVTVESDKDLRQFMSGLDDSDLVSIEFPITLVKYDGTEIQVNSNAELANAIESARNACDEDDDNDHNDDDFDKERLDNLLAECPWLVKEVIRDEVNQTDQYFEYVMNFNENGTVVVKDRMGNSLEGTWSTRISDRGVLLKLEFDVLVDFNLEWVVYELGEGVIKLYEEGGNKILMHIACDLFNTPPDSLRDILRECVWIIKKVKNQGEEIDRLIGFEFQFLAGGVVTLSDGTTTSEGTWEITTNAQGRLVMAISMGDEPAVNFEWPISELRDDRLKFEVEDIDYELVLQRVCEDNDGDVMEIRNVLMGGEWMIALFEEGEVNATANYGDYTFYFHPNHRLEVSINDMPVRDGIWRVIRNSDGKLKVYLNLGDEDPLGEITDDWYFVSLTADRLELIDESGDGTVSSLVFEKNP
ncbi:hypothetical protein [Poritiphilus flavus]|uniref:Lipocalin-like domain-containing protein n=1 Tax=Poritiphilus flavus TaxID=2697053 RepID=A0A6L9EHW8_9FLAO|nr:hypothetical protein [Poritiphilus flavus]NAS14252.1 hypothetical protein [Poritiphilus flavus]